ncbi:hypothetical protein [Methylopila turkensis]|uniref:Uncharacterized protein n=1 Tax=Methylopila turkensis TaxID=1437816 RepID=A0A9W6N5U7_9HYPH|nr:hypothetical protein [Methylopila turkensis]GLK79554.1 hypothetical protein GCM10008174_12950 [Methylopila turkensis]
MTRIGLVAAAAVAMASTVATQAQSQSATTVVWQGEATILTVTPSCTSNKNERQTIGVGTVLRTLLRPAGLGANGTTTRMSFNHDGQANAVYIMPGTPGEASGTYASFGAAHNGVLLANRAATYARFSSIPATITAATVFIEYRGALAHFLAINNCTVTFRAAYSPRP